MICRVGKLQTNMSVIIQLLRCLLLLAVAVALGPTSAHAAQATDTVVCFRGQPMPRCDWFFITEFGVIARLAGSEPDLPPLTSRQKVTAVWELGAMRNLTPSSAFGATLFFANPDADESRAAVRLRYRRWLKSGFALHVAPGLLVEANDVASDFRFAPKLPGFSGQVGVTWRDRVTASTGIDVVKAGPQTIADWTMSVRAGAGAGAVGLLAIAALTVIGILTL